MKGVALLMKHEKRIIEIQLENQMNNAELIEDSILKDVTLYSLNRQYAQLQAQCIADKRAGSRLKKQVSVQKASSNSAKLSNLSSVRTRKTNI